MRGSKCFTSRLQARTPQWLHNLEGLSLPSSLLTVIHSTPPLLAYKYINYISTHDDLARMTSQLESV